jgi:hypothetical protein
VRLTGGVVSLAIDEVGFLVEVVVDLSVKRAELP